MQGPTLAEYFQRTGIDRYPAFTPLVQLGNKPFKSNVQKPSLSVHYQWYRLPHELGSWKSIPAVGAAPYYICIGNLKLLCITSKNWNDASSGGGEHTYLNLMQQVFALDDELAMAGKSMTGAV